MLRYLLDIESSRYDRFVQVKQEFFRINPDKYISPPSSQLSMNKLREKKKKKGKIDTRNKIYKPARRKGKRFEHRIVRR